ncbi:MAG: hypothetical protein QW356_07995 [Candidatus Hadarchaeales archaeon]
MSILNSFELVEEVKEQQPQPKPYKPDDYIRLWSTSIGSVIIVLERLKGTPALYLWVFHNGEPVFKAGPFYSKKSFDNLRINWEDVAVELEKRGARPLTDLPPSGWAKILEQVREKVPDSPVMPRVSEVGAPTLVTIEDLARRGDLYRLSPVEFEGIIVGRSEIKTVPVAIKRKLKNGEYEEFFNLTLPQEAIRFVSHSGERVDEARFFILQLQQYMEHYRFTVYAIGCEVPRSKKVRVRGVVVSEGTRAPYRPVVLATEVEPLNEVVERLEITSELLKEAGFRVSSYEELKQLMDQVLAPEIVGRPLAKVACALTLFSVEKLCYGSIVWEGLLRTLFFGDTRTGKSTIARWFYDNAGVGAFTTAETGSRAGLLYTVDTDTRTIIWGVVTLADREYAVIDGFDKMNPEEWKECREAINNQKVVVAKKVQGVAPFRVRLILCANTKERMSSYTYPVEGIADIPTLMGKDSGASVTRIDLFIPFKVDDVPASEIVRAPLTVKPPNVEALKRKILIAWKATCAVFEEGAIRRLADFAQSLIEEYGSIRPPIIHNDYLRVVLKVAAAFASLLGRYRLTERGLEVVVTEEVVPFVEAFFNEYFALLCVEPYAEVMREDVEEALSQIDGDPTLLKALLAIDERSKQGVPVTKTELGTVIGVRGHDKQQAIVHRLSGLRLIYSRRGSGLFLTELGKRVVKEIKRGKKVEGAPPLGVGGITPTNPPPECQVPSGPHVKGTTEDFKSYPQILGSQNQVEAYTIGIEEEKEVPSLPSSEAEGSAFLKNTDQDLSASVIPFTSDAHRTCDTGGGFAGGNTPPPSTPGSSSEGVSPEDQKHEERIVKESVAEPKAPSQRAESSEEENRKEYTPGFGACYLRMAELLKSNPDGLPEDAVIRELVGMGFSEKLIRAVLSFAKQQGKVSVPREGWLLWG